jgi:hypothetical protein
LKIEEQTADNRVNDFVLNGKYVCHRAVEFLGEDMSAGLRIGQLHGGAHSLGG